MPVVYILTEDEKILGVYNTYENAAHAMNSKKADKKGYFDLAITEYNTDEYEKDSKNAIRVFSLIIDKTNSDIDCIEEYYPEDEYSGDCFELGGFDTDYTFTAKVRADGQEEAIAIAEVQRTQLIREYFGI